jgi:hypothetical protein
VVLAYRPAATGRTIMDVDSDAVADKRIFTRYCQRQRERKYSAMDRVPVFSASIEWTSGRCVRCNAHRPLIKHTKQCGSCYIEQRRD